MAKYKKLKNRNLYYYRINTGKNNKNGTIKYKTLYGKTIQELESKIKDFYNKLSKDIDIEFENIYFKDWIDTYVQRYKSELKDSTKEIYNLYIKKYYKPAIGEYKLKDIKPMHIQKMFNDIIKQNPNLTYNYLKEILIKIKIIFESAVTDKLILKSPVYNIHISGRKTETREVLDEFQCQILYEFCTGEKSDISIMALLAVYCGLRKSEALALTISDICNGYIKVNKQLFYNSEKKSYETTTPKTSSGNRTIPIPNKIILCIEEKITQCLENNTTILFFNNNGKYADNAFKLFETNWNILKEKLNCFSDFAFGNICFHELRHTYCSQLHKMNIDEMVIKKYMGHANYETSLSTYTHLTTQQRAIQFSNIIAWRQEIDSDINNTNDETEESAFHYKDYIQKAKNKSNDITDEQWEIIRKKEDGYYWRRHLNRNMINICLKIILQGIDVYTVAQVTNTSIKSIKKQLINWESSKRIYILIEDLGYELQDISKYYNTYFQN